MSLTRTTMLAVLALAAAVPARAVEIRDRELPPGLAPRGPGAERPAAPALAPQDLREDPRGAPVPGTMPGQNIGGTPTSGPPGTGGAAGGPSIGGQ